MITRDISCNPMKDKVYSFKCWNQTHMIVLSIIRRITTTQRWGAADGEIKVSSDEHTELKHSPFKPWSRSVYRHNATLTARDFFVAYLYPSGPFTCIFSQNLSRFLLCWLWLTHGSCVGPQNKIGHPAGCKVPC